MSADHHPEAIKKQVSLYWKVFGALTIGTIITVAIANVHLGILLGIAVALVVALVKGSLVAGYFMHLFHEVKWIYGVLLLTAVFFVVLIALVMWTTADQQGRHSGTFAVPQRHVEPHHATEAAEAH